MLDLFDALELIRKNEENCDALRAGWIQAVSSFDFFMHEVSAVELRHRLENQVPIRNVLVSIDTVRAVIDQQRIDLVEDSFRKSNSYKSFVDPQNVGELLGCFVESGWDKIADVFELNYKEGLDSGELKRSIKRIWIRRNKIAHEADINPSMAGVSLWPLSRDDLDFTITRIERVGKSVPPVLAHHCY
ncbi:MAG: hypothetical protein LAT81_10150 [Oceanicaulis sp.]|nr:hypothetical protein [Oceanicaulis sp.]